MTRRKPTVRRTSGTKLVRAPCMRFGTSRRDPRARTRERELGSPPPSPSLNFKATRSYIRITQCSTLLRTQGRRFISIHSRSVNCERRALTANYAANSLRAPPSSAPPALSTLLDRRATLRNLRERVRWDILERDAWSAAPAPWHGRRTRKPGNTTAEASPRPKTLPSLGTVNLEPGRPVSRTLARGSAQPGLSITHPALVRHAVHDRQSHSSTFGRVL